MKPRKYALFTVPGRGLAVEIESLLQVVELPRVFPLPGLTAGFSGVSVLAETLVPVVALRILAAEASAVTEQARYLAVCTTEYGLLGLPVDQAKQVVELPSETQDLPEADACPGVIASCRMADELYGVLDLDLLVRHFSDEKTFGPAGPSRRHP